MRTKVTPILVSMILIVFLCAPSRSQDWSLQKRISEAMEAYRRGDSAPLNNLASSAELLSGLQYLEPYTKDLDPDIRGAVAVLVYNIKDPRILPLLATLVGDDSAVSHVALDILLRNFGRREISEARTIGLQSALMHFAVSAYGPRRVSGEALLLLSCFGSDKAVSLFLENLRSVSETEHHLIIVYPQDIPARVGIDLALAELGDRNALARTMELLACNDDDGSVVFILRSMRFITADGVFGYLVRMTRVERQVFYTPPGNSIRMCDVAISQFCRMLGENVVGVPGAGEQYRYSDAQLATASARLEAWLVSRNRQQ